MSAIFFRFSSKDIWFPYNKYSISKYKSMKFKHKVYNHKKKVGFECWGYVPNGQTWGLNKHFSSFQAITCGTLYNSF